MGDISELFIFPIFYCISLFLLSTRLWKKDKITLENCGVSMQFHFYFLHFFSCYMQFSYKRKEKTKKSDRTDNKITIVFIFPNLFSVFSHDIKKVDDYKSSNSQGNYVNYFIYPIFFLFSHFSLPPDYIKIRQII